MEPCCDHWAHVLATYSNADMAPLFNVSLPSRADPPMELHLAASYWEGSFLRVDLKAFPPAPVTRKKLMSFAPTTSANGSASPSCLSKKARDRRCQKARSSALMRRFESFARDRNQKSTKPHVMCILRPFDQVITGNAYENVPSSFGCTDCQSR
jgi:hypothetical protein